MYNTNSDIYKNFRYPMIAVIGFLFANIGLFGGMPFCAAFIGSLSDFGCITAFTASAFALIFRGENADIIPTLTSLVAIGFMRLVIGHKKSPRYEMLSSAFTGIAVLAAEFIKAEIPSELLTSFALAIITAVCAYSLMQCYKIIAAGQFLSSLGRINTAAVAVVSVFFVAALTDCEFGVINMGLVLSAYLTIGFAERYGFSGGAICGAVAGMGVATGDGRYVYTALILCSAGAAAAFFKGSGRLFQAAGFILTAGICSAILGAGNFPLAAACAFLAGGAVFYIIPPDKLTERFNRKVTVRNSADISQIYAERLRNIGLAMGGVKSAILKTAEILDKKSFHNHSWVYNSACDGVCERCRDNMKCWGDEYNDTIKGMEAVVKLMRTGKQPAESDLPPNVSARCQRKDELIAALNKQYREYVSTKASARKLGEMRSILTTQLSATEKMLETMADDFGQTEQYDKTLSAKAEEILEAHGITDAGAVILSCNNHLAIEAYGKGRLTCAKEKLCDLISIALNHEFDLPNITYDGGKMKLTMYERTMYSIECGSFQFSKEQGKEKNCGDYFDSFIDGRGRAYIVLSDGMGSGNRARIDSSFACGMLVKLLQAGVGLDSAIEIINSSLLVKSSDESFATLDICEIDLYTGNVKLYKAGSAPTYIKCNKQVVKAGGRGLPVGVSGKPLYELQNFTIGNSDIIIMTSDGAELSERWLEHELNKNGVGTADMENIAEAVAGAAKFAAERGREDDISVIAVKLVK